MATFVSLCYAIFMIDIRWFIVAVVRHFRQSLCVNQAAALAYDTLLALVPCLVLSFHLLTQLPIAPDAILRAKVWLLDHLVIETAQQAHHVLSDLLYQASSLSPWMWLGLFATASLLVSNLQETFARIWGVPLPPLQRIRVPIYGLLLVMFPMCLTYTLLFATYFATTLPWITAFLSKSLVIAFLYFTYTWMSAVSVPSWVAAASTGIVVSLMVILKFLIIFYFSFFHSSYHIIYGALASIPIFLIWLFMVWLSILLGSVVSYVLVTCRKT